MSTHRVRIILGAAAITLAASPACRRSAPDEEGAKAGARGPGRSVTGTDPAGVGRQSEFARAREELRAALPPLPAVVAGSGLLPGTSVATVSRGWGQPFKLTTDFADLVQWAGIPVGACPRATVSVVEDDQAPGTAYAWTVRLDRCPEVGLAWLNALGSLAAQTEDEDRWVYREARVVRPRASPSLTFRIGPLFERDSGEVGHRPRPESSEEILAEAERMKQPVAKLDLDCADPVSGLAAFQPALVEADPRLIGAVAWPFTANGEVVPVAERAADLDSLLDPDLRDHLRWHVKAATDCRVVPLSELLAGPVSRPPANAPDAARPPVTQAEKAALLHALDGDAVVSCTATTIEADGALYLFRKAGDRWRPAGFVH
jgi:hypothetical protein